MRRIGLAFAYVLIGVGIALAAQKAIVVTSVTYDAGFDMPMTQTTAGALRVSCS